MKNAKILNSLFWSYLFLSLFREVIEVCFERLLIASILSYLLLLMALITIIFFAHRKSLLVNFLVFIGIPISFLLNILFFRDSEPYISELMPVIVTSRIPALLLMLNVTKWDDFYIKMKRVSIPYFLLGILYLAIFLLGNYNEEATNYMRMAYNVLMSVCVIGIIGLIERRILYNILYWVALIAIFISGCRGALGVGACVYGLSYLVVKERSVKIKWIFSGIVIFALAIAYNYEEVESFIISRDSESRIARKMDAGILFESEGRTLIQTVVMNEVRSKDFMPLGLCADREIADRTLGYPSYVHNIALEFIVDYGIVIGALLFLSLLVFTIKTIRKSELVPKIVLCFFASYSIAKLMISSSYLEEISFYIYMGALFAAHNSCRKKQIEQIIKK